MRLPWNRTNDPELAGASPPPPSGPYARRYDIAREGYEMRVAQLARALDQATLKNYLAAGVNLVLAIGIITIALRGGVRPIFIPYDQFGRVIRAEDLSRFREPPRRFIDAGLAEWIVNVRGIYYDDPIAQLDRARAAKALLAPEAERWLDQYFSDPSRNPVDLLKSNARTVNGVTMSKDPDRNVWYLQWRELAIPAQGPHTESAWQATVKVELSPARSETEVYANPAGIRIRSIEWHRVSSQVAQPPAAAGAPRTDSAVRPVTGRTR